MYKSDYVKVCASSCFLALAPVMYFIRVCLYNFLYRILSSLLHSSALCLNSFVASIYNLTNYCTIIPNTIITNNMLLHVSTFKMSSSGSSLCCICKRCICCDRSCYGQDVYSHYANLLLRCTINVLLKFNVL